MAYKRISKVRFEPYLDYEKVRLIKFNICYLFNSDQKIKVF